MKTVVSGWPRAGKTTWANEHADGIRVMHTDDLIGMGWSRASEKAVEWFNEPGPWIIEGVTAIRALRKWLKYHDAGRPCDRLVWMARPYHVLTPGQRSLGKGCDTVLRQVIGELKERGVLIERLR